MVDSMRGLTAELAAFEAAYPGYRGTGRVDDLRAGEYGYLDERGQVYLDYAGAGLPARAQLRAHADRVTGGYFGNPHSDSPASTAATELVERTRAAVLAHFNADPAEYAAIFTANATGACRLVGEAYPFGPGTRLVLTFDNHNSVNGIREYARARGAATSYVPVTPELRVDEPALVAELSRPAERGRFGRRRQLGGSPAVGRPSAGPSVGRAGLLALPAQSNFSGVQHPLRLVDAAQRLGYDVLLDAAAYVPTNRLDLSLVRPDFVPVSWYKVFGYPTGVGCLLARREALRRLRRPWFSGGTIQAVSVQGDWHLLTGDESAYEDGTLNFLSIPDVAFGLSWLDAVGLDTVHQRVSALTGWLLRRLGELRHGTGAPLTRVYGPSTMDCRGGTVAFNVLDPAGRVVDERIVSRDAAAGRISLRAGCFCNPGAGEGAFDIPVAALTGAIGREPRTIDEYLQLLGLPSAGAIRVSLGIASNLADVERLIGFVGSYRDVVPDRDGLSPRLRC